MNISRLPVCRACLSDIRSIEGGVCDVCGERLLNLHALPAEAGETRCGLCRRTKPPFVKASAYGSYDGGLRELIHLLKYQQVRPASGVLGCMLAEAVKGLESGLMQGPVIAVPVPLHARKLRQRGFNQSELIARDFIKLPASRGRMILRSGVLLRRRQTQSQIGLTRHQRRENVRGAFVVARAEEIAGRKILLIDDVFTTGTTASECARVLRRAGASEVFVATVARTLKIVPEAVEWKHTSTQHKQDMAATG